MTYADEQTTIYESLWDTHNSIAENHAAPCEWRYMHITQYFCSNMPDNNFRPTTVGWIHYFVDQGLVNVFVVRDGKVVDVLRDNNAGWTRYEINDTYCSIAVDKETA